MESDDEYEILSHDKVEHLRKEVDKLKADTMNTNRHENELISSMNRLTAHIAKLIDIFSNVQRDLEAEKKLSEQKDAKIERLINQNARIIQDYEDYQKMYSQEQSRQENYQQYNNTPPYNQRPPQGRTR